jgi:hypothetical protein
MTIRSVSSYLTRFDTQAPPISIQTESALTPLDILPDEPITFDLNEDESTLREEMRSALQADFDAAIEQERAASAERLRVERDRWTNDEAVKLSEQVARAIEAGLGGLRSDIARILTPFVSEQISRRVLDDLIAAVRAGLADVANPAIEISGASDLLERMRIALVEKELATTMRETDEIDARVTLGSTVIETRLSEWMSQLRAESEVS